MNILIHWHFGQRISHDAHMSISSLLILMTMHFMGKNKSCNVTSKPFGLHATTKTKKPFSSATLLTNDNR